MSFGIEDAQNLVIDLIASGWTPPHVAGNRTNSSATLIQAESLLAIVLQYMPAKEALAALEEANNTARIMAEAADANVKRAALERQEHRATSDILRTILDESGRYLQTATRDCAHDRLRSLGCTLPPPPMR